MLKLDQIFLRDARPENVKLAKDIKRVIQRNGYKVYERDD